MIKVTANEIQRNLLDLVKGSYDVVLPNFYYGHHECDVFRITQTDYVFEYEIKVSRADFFNDFKKECHGNKHENLKTASGEWCPNRFFFVVPKGLVKVTEVPDYAGLIYYNKSGLNYAKTAKLLHNNKFTNYRSICHTLAGRDQGFRRRIKEIRNIDFEKEMATMRREVEAIKLKNKTLATALTRIKNIELKKPK